MQGDDVDDVDAFLLEMQSSCHALIVHDNKKSRES
jgi:hypothetical protein